MALFYLIRHGEPDWGFKEQRRLSPGRRDFVPLTPLGVEQAERTMNCGELKNCELILSSPYTRSLQTAAVMNRTLGLPLHVEFDLHEWTPDNWQAQNEAEITELWNDYRLHNGEHPNGETRLWETKSSVMKRTMGVLEKYKHRSKVIVVCHGMVIATLLGHSSEQVPYCGIYPFEW
ncbi:histidine phosphatase family protein [Paenibacillus piri]|uniref:Histidine phosphatase family protein n=1 Tax=Paenibacillus piri TaxID=2547395 RepID=A0A4R5KR83_9BACL|nr:histidine phosphatase family protein [Paenibacillus piri]TDF98106.1 histidine phosphatase family protein [Paenibacillus piri]